MKTLDGRVITVPNSTFTTSSVTNYSKSGRIQARIPITFPPDIDLEMITQIMRAAVKDIEQIRPYHIDVIITGMALSGISRNVAVEFRFWIDRFIERDQIYSKVMIRMKEKFVKENIIIHLGGAFSDSLLRSLSFSDPVLVTGNVTEKENSLSGFSGNSIREVLRFTRPMREWE